MVKLLRPEDAPATEKQQVRAQPNTTKSAATRNRGRASRTSRLFDNASDAAAVSRRRRRRSHRRALHVPLRHRREHGRWITCSPGQHQHDATRLVTRRHAASSTNTATSNTSIRCATHRAGSGQCRARHATARAGCRATGRTSNRPTDRHYRTRRAATRAGTRTTNWTTFLVSSATTTPTRRPATEQRQLSTWTSNRAVDGRR